MATVEYDSGTHFHLKVPRSTRLIVSYLAHPKGQPDEQGASSWEQLGVERVMEAISVPRSISFGIHLFPALGAIQNDFDFDWRRMSQTIFATLRVPSNSNQSLNTT